MSDDIKRLRKCPFCGALPWKPGGKVCFRVRHEQGCYLEDTEFRTRWIYPEQFAAWNHRGTNQETTNWMTR